MIKILKKSERGSVSVLRSKATGERFVFRRTGGSGEVYRKLMTVSCRNLPKIIEVDENGGEVFVLEEFVQGDTLYYLLETDVIPKETAIKLTEQLCEGLKVLHGLGAVHRDIKPENIIIRGNEAVLIDFDASRMVDPDKDGDTKILGTMGFAAPEQYGLSQTDARADIYSLGVLLNVMLTGEHPSTKFVSGELGDIVQKCTMISPEMRYQDAQELETVLLEKLPGKKKRSWVFAAAAAIFVFAAVFFGINLLPEESEEALDFRNMDLYGTGIQIMPLNVKDIPEGEVRWLEVSGWESGTGESDILPDEFYGYWDKKDFVKAEQIKISVPGNIENYISYEFSDDILKINVGNVPKEEWEFAASKLEEGRTDFFVNILIEAPSDDITKYLLQQGVEDTYSFIKENEAKGASFPYADFDPESEFAVTDRPFAEIEETGSMKKILQNCDGSIDYAVIVWKDNFGRKTTQIIPYMITCSEKEVVLTEKTDYETWMDAVWEPISDPGRIVYKSVTKEIYMFPEDVENRGVDITLFAEPGHIFVDFLENEKFDADILANLEAVILPPDAGQRQEGESAEKYIQRVYLETEYTGFKVNSTNVGTDYEEETVNGQRYIIENAEFHTIEKNGYSSANIIPLSGEAIGEFIKWRTIDYGRIIMIIDWYKDDPEMKPAKREYIYTDCEKFSYNEKIGTEGASEAASVSVPSPGTVIASGFCGENGGTNLSWTFDSKGILTISGNGRMADYDDIIGADGNPVSTAPWGEYISEARYLVIGEGITYIGENAFRFMRKLSGRFELPSTLEEIGFFAFCANNFSGKLEIPEGCTSIANFSFQAAGNFSSVYIPSTVAEIGCNPFRYCKVDEFIVSGNNPNFCSVEGGLYNKSVTEIIACPDGVTGILTIPKSVDTLCICAFESASAKRINIMGNIIHIDELAFQGYGGEVAFYGNVGNISADAFSRFTNDMTVYFISNNG